MLHNICQLAVQQIFAIALFFLLQDSVAVCHRQFKYAHIYLLETIDLVLENPSDLHPVASSKGHGL